jgi:ribonuclease VapC
LIAIDSSALMAIVLDEPQAERCAEALASDDEILISATTLAEVLIVAAGREVAEDIQHLLTEIGPTIVPVTAETPARIAGIHFKWGKRRHPAQLNICDCFSYDVAREYDCPLLFVGNDFARTDIKSALAL